MTQSIELSTSLSKAEQNQRAVLEGTVRDGMATFYLVGCALRTIRDLKLYRDTHESFDDYCQEIFEFAVDRGEQYITASVVVDNLKEEQEVVLPWNERQTRPLAKLDPEKQRLAWGEATKKDEKPTGSYIGKVVKQLFRKGFGGGKRGGSTKGEDATSWTDDELKADGELFNSLKSIAAIFGNDDTRAIRDGTIGYTRAEIITLAKLGEKMKELRDLIMETKWPPKDCLKFLNEMMDGDSTVEEIYRWMLCEKSKVFESDYRGATLTLRLKRAIPR